MKQMYLLASIAGLLFFAACEKKSPLSAEEILLQKTWHSSSMQVDGKQMNNPNYVLSFKSGSFNYQTENYHLGSYQISEDHKHIKMAYTSSEHSNWEILVLSKSMLKVQYDSDNHTRVIEFKISKQAIDNDILEQR